MRLMNTTRRALLGALSAALMAAAMIPAYAQDELIVVKQDHAMTYLNGGVGVAG
jgi:hypothetical protein